MLHSISLFQRSNSSNSRKLSKGWEFLSTFLFDSRKRQCKNLLEVKKEGVHFLQFLPQFKMVYNIRFSIFIALFVTFSDAQWNTNDYMKREHSLVKPYQGMKISFLKKAEKAWLFFFKRFGIRCYELGFSRKHNGHIFTCATHSKWTKSTRSHLEH